MNDFESYPVLNANSLLMNAIHQQNFNISSTNEFDPYQVLLKRKKQQDSGEMPPIKDIDPNDLYELQKFCQEHGIVGFNFGRMNPKTALQILKSRMGIKETTPPPQMKKSILLG